MPLGAAGCVVGFLVGAVVAGHAYLSDPLARSVTEPPRVRTARPAVTGTEDPMLPSNPRDDEWIVRMQRLEALIHIKEPDVLEELLAGLRTSDDLPGGVHVRTTAARVLADAGWTQAAPEILLALDREDTFFARPVYAVALHRLGDPTGLERLRKMLDRYSPGIDRLAPGANERQLTAMCAAGAAAAQGIEELGQKIASYLEDTDPEIVKETLRYLQTLKYRPAVPAIAGLLDREDCSTV